MDPHGKLLPKRDLKLPKRTAVIFLPREKPGILHRASVATSADIEHIYDKQLSGRKGHGDIAPVGMKI